MITSIKLLEANQILAQVLDSKNASQADATIKTDSGLMIQKADVTDQLKSPKKRRYRILQPW